MVRFGSYKLLHVGDVFRIKPRIYTETFLPSREVSHRDDLGGRGIVLSLEGKIGKATLQEVGKERAKFEKFEGKKRYFEMEDNVTPEFKGLLEDLNFIKTKGFPSLLKYSCRILQVELENLIFGGDFERDDDNDGVANHWTEEQVIGTPEFFLSTTSYEGDYSQEIQLTQSQCGLVKSEEREIEAGKTYKAEVRLRSLLFEEAYCKLQIDWLNASHERILLETIQEGIAPADWTLWGGEATAPILAVYAMIYLVGATTVGEADSVAFDEATFKLP